MVETLPITRSVCSDPHSIKNLAKRENGSESKNRIKRKRYVKSGERNRKNEKKVFRLTNNAMLSRRDNLESKKKRTTYIMKRTDETGYAT